MIRIILVAIFLLLYSIISLILYPAIWLIGKFNKKAKDKSSLFIVKNSFKVVRFLSGTRTTVIGYDRIPKDEPVLFVGNHKSYFDIVISYSLMPGLTGFVAKKELKKVPVISWWMRNLYCLFLDRNDTREGLKTILEGIDYIKKEYQSLFSRKEPRAIPWTCSHLRKEVSNLPKRPDVKSFPWSRIIQEPVLKISFRESKKHIPLSNSANLLTLNPFQKRKENLLVTM